MYKYSYWSFFKKFFSLNLTWSLKKRWLFPLLLSFYVEPIPLANGTAIKTCEIIFFELTNICEMIFFVYFIFIKTANKGRYKERVGSKYISTLFCLNTLPTVIGYFKFLCSDWCKKNKQSKDRIYYSTIKYVWFT